MAQEKDLTKLKSHELEELETNNKSNLDFFRKNPTYDTMNILFSSHPFYKKTSLYENDNRLFCEFKIYIRKGKQWIKGAAVAIGTNGKSFDDLAKQVLNKMKELEAIDLFEENKTNLNFF